VPVVGAGGEKTVFPNASGVYAVYDKDGRLQYMGLSRKVSAIQPLLGPA
jgi:hypothetical protein